MTNQVFFIVLGAALLHAVWNAIIKSGGDKFFETVMKTTAGGFATAFILPFIPAPPPESWPYLGTTMLLHVGYYLSVAYAYKHADLGYAYTIMRGAAPLGTTLLAMLLLGEHLGVWGLAGICLLCGGILTLALDAVHNKGFSRRATATAMGNAAIITAYTLVDGTGVRLAGSATTYVCWEFFLNAFPLLALTCISHRKAYFGYLKKRWAYGLAGGVCSLLSYGMALWGMLHAPIAVVAALRESSVIFGLIIAVLFLGEKASPARGIAVLGVFAGAAVLKVWG